MSARQCERVVSAITRQSWAITPEGLDLVLGIAQRRISDPQAVLASPAERREGGRERPYILKGDVSAYFASIDHDILLRRVRRVVSDPDALWLFESIVRKAPGYQGVGLPLGSLTSQWLANLYLDPLDHLLKDDLGVPFYMRYMDDWVLVGPSKEWCRVLLDQITGFLALQKLAVNPKTAIYPASHGVDFVGYRHWTDHTLPRKRTVKRARAQFRALRRLYARGRIDLDYVRPRVASFTGYMGHCDGRRTLDAILAEFILKRPS